MAQWKSVPFTPERSLVRSQLGPPKEETPGSNCPGVSSYFYRSRSMRRDPASQGRSSSAASGNGQVAATVQSVVSDRSKVGFSCVWPHCRVSRGVSRRPIKTGVGACAPVLGVDKRGADNNVASGLVGTSVAGETTIASSASRRGCLPKEASCSFRQQCDERR